MSKSRKERNLVFYICAFLIPVLIMLVIMYIQDCYPFGNTYTILHGDSYHQYIQFFYLLHERIADGKSFLFSWDTGMGFDFLTNFFYYLSNPCNFIVLLFGKQNIELGMVVAIMIQMGGCAVTTMYYFMHSKINRMKDEKWNPVVCLLFSIAYALCDYILAYRFNLMWLMGMMLIPLLMLGVEYLVDRNDGRLYGVLLFIGFISNFYFAWFLCIWAIVCFFEQQKEDFSHLKKAFIKFASISILSALCAAMVLIPSYISILSGGSSSWYTLDSFELTDHDMAGNFLNGFFWGHNVSLLGDDLYTQNNYCGVFVLVLVCVYFFNKSINRKQKVKRIIEIAIFSIAMNWIGALWVFHGFTIPHAYMNRYAFLLVFLLIMTAFESLYKINEVRFRYIGISGLLVIGMFLLAIFNGSLTDTAICYVVTMFLCTYLLICLFLHRNKSISRKALIFNLCLIGFLELLSNPFATNVNSSALRTDLMANAADWKPVYNEIEPKNGERKTAFMQLDFSVFSYSQTDVYASAINSDLLDLFESLGLSDGQLGRNYAYMGTTPLTAALFNVRYVITEFPEKFGGYNIKENGDSYRLYEATDLVGFGFLLPENVISWNTDGVNMFEIQNDFSRNVLGKGELFTQVMFDDIQIECDACEIIGNTDETCYYISQGAYTDSYPSILWTATIPSDMELYISSKSENKHICVVFVDGVPLSSNMSFAPDDSNTIYVGKLCQGQQIQLGIVDMSGIQDLSAVHTFFYAYHDDVMQECLMEMKKSVYEIDTFEDTYVSGVINVKEDGILYTSIPYYRGFKAYVDGEEVEIVQIGGAMSGVRVTAGEHRIEFKYFPYGLRLGILVSGIGFLIVFGSGIYKKKKGE